MHFDFVSCKLGILLINSNSFFIDLQTKLYHLQIEIVLLLPFQSECLLNFFCLIALARTFSTMLKTRGEKEHPRSVHALRGKLLVFHH